MPSCPTCGDNFGTSGGMKLHHTRTHGESIAGEKVYCDNCDDSFRKKKSQINEKNFCDTTCKAEWQSENIKGENHPAYSKIDTECENCGKSLKRKQCRSDNRHFCNQSCQGEWRSHNLNGSDAWAYKDGSSLENYYNTVEWKRFKRKMREMLPSDCQVCGDKSGRQNALHHIIRMGDFDERGNANFKENVVFLCQSHHMELENQCVEKQIERLNSVSHIPDSVEELNGMAESNR